MVGDLDLRGDQEVVKPQHGDSEVLLLFVRFNAR